MQVGELKFVTFPFAPRGWVSCAGQLLEVANYPELSSALGTTFGGDGKTTFGVPNTAGRMLLGKHDALAVGATGGVAPGTHHLPYLVLHCIVPTSASVDFGQPFYGEIRAFGGNYAPPGWAICDGSELRIVHDTLTLFYLIRNTFGGDGTTTFRLPDLRGRALIGSGKAANGAQFDLGATGSIAVSGAPSTTLHYLISVGGIYPSRSDA